MLACACHFAFPDADEDLYNDVVELLKTDMVKRISHLEGLQTQRLQGKGDVVAGTIGEFLQES